MVVIVIVIIIVEYTAAIIVIPDSVVKWQLNRKTNTKKSKQKIEKHMTDINHN